MFSFLKLLNTVMMVNVCKKYIKDILQELGSSIFFFALFLFERVKVLLETIISCLYEVLAEYRHISTIWAVSSLTKGVRYHFCISIWYTCFASCVFLGICRRKSLFYKFKIHE